MDPYAYQYLVVVMFLAIAALFPLAPLLIAWLIAPRKPSPMKQATYECGVESKGDAWVRFRVHYYLYALAFVAFDLEAPFLYAWAVVFNKLPFFVFVEMLIFIGVLTAGLVYAWTKGALEWD